MIRQSLRWRLLAGGAAAITLALLLAGAGLGELFERHLVRSLEDDLDATQRLVLGAVEVPGSGGLRLAREPADPRFSEPLSGLYWQVSRGGEVVLRSRSLWDSTLPLPSDDLAPGTIHHHRIAGPAGSRLLASERRVLVKGRDAEADVRVVVAADMRRIAGARQSFTSDLIAALTLLGAVLGVAMWVQTNLGLRPLEDLRERILSIRRGRMRSVAGPVPSEVAPLVDEINALLDSQAREMERSRGRAADLAHGLKTPLAALAADARRLRDKGLQDIAADVEQVGETMHRHVERELARARARTASGENGTIETKVRPLLETLSGMLRRAPGGMHIAFEFDMPENYAIGMDKTDLAEVLGNLLENAARHAKSRVIIRGTSEDGIQRVVIEDDGGGVPADAIQKILKRGGKLDRQEDGAGLGLAIAQDVLEAYGRRLDLETSPQGGLKATF